MSDNYPSTIDQTGEPVPDEDWDWWEDQQIGPDPRDADPNW